jgi:DNA polymerase-1
MRTYEDILQLPAPLNEHRLILFDGHSLAYRSYYAIRELTSPSGEPVQALYGFWRALLRTIRAFPSAYAAVAFDAGGPTFRHEAYAEYKATRTPMPEDLASQIPLIRQLLEALGVAVFCEQGVEADDVLATLAEQAAASDLDCLIVTSDKDMMQIVSDRISILRPTGKGGQSDYTLLDPEGVEAKYGVRPEQIVDLLSLVGDSSDNIPGVPAVGEKTAAKLLAEYGSLDNILANAGEVRNVRIRDSLQTHAETAEEARRLIQLRTEVPLEKALSRCRLHGVQAERLAQFLEKVGFQSALSELALEPSEPQMPPAVSRDADYQAVLTEEALESLVGELGTAERVSIDLETTSVRPMQADIVGIAVSCRPYEAAYIPIGHNGLGTPDQLPLTQVLTALRPTLEGDTAIIGQNIKYDLIVLSRYGVCVRNVIFDSMIASHLTHPEERRHNLDLIAETVLGHQMTSYAEVAGKNGAFSAVAVPAATDYAGEDAEIVQRLYPVLRQRLEDAGAVALFEGVEIPLVSVLARMEENGILVD